MKEMHENLLLKELIVKVEETLLKQGYSKKYRNTIRRTYRKLLEYADDQEINRMTDNLKKRFALTIYGFDVDSKIPKRDVVVRSLQLLLDYQEIGSFSRRRLPYFQWPESHAAFFEEYFCATNSGKALSTLKTYRFFLMNIAQYLTDTGQRDISEVNAETIRNFALSLARFSQPVANRNMRVLSDVLHYAYKKGLHSKDLSCICPKVMVYRNQRIPSVFTEEEIDSMLSQIDRKSPMGKRDYAILLLAKKTGLRSGDIRRLKFSNFHWNTGTLEITQNKTSKILVLPLMEDVGLAIIDYLQNSRPQIQSDYIFVGIKAPFKEHLGRMNLIAKKYMLQAGIEGLETRRPGLHALRHSLASTMLEKGAPIHLISGVLGHQSFETIRNYAKVNMAQLRQCALEVPDV